VNRNVRYAWTCTCGAGLDPERWRQSIYWIGTVAPATCWQCENAGLNWICLRSETGKPCGVVRIRQFDRRLEPIID